jgi:UDP-N-acetylglucosamine 2-epimerase (non-hydrolysing)
LFFSLLSDPLDNLFRMNVVCVAGARPNFMKIKPVMDALEDGGASTTLVHTGQHYDNAMSAVFLQELRIRPPDHYLDAGSGTHAEQAGRVMVAFEPLLESLRPDVTVVVGDVNSTMASAVVSAKAGCLTAHVEAGLRSRDWSMPEEINRVVTDRVSDLLFAPSDEAVGNLRREGFRPDQIHLVGNVMIDTLLTNVDVARSRPILSDLGLRPNRYGVVTLHRPTNVDDPYTLVRLLEALGAVSARIPLVWPVHPRARSTVEQTGVPAGLEVIAPIGYLDFIALESQARLVLTDSGGIQEETTVLGVPCLTLRDTTERPITISEGTNRLVGLDPGRIIAAALEVLANGVEPRRPALWDGQAGERIARIMLDVAAGDGPLRPTQLRPHREPADEDLHLSAPQ